MADVDGDDTDRQKEVEQLLRDSIQAFACPLDEQMTLCAPFECPACELVASFYDVYQPFISLRPNLAPEKRSLLAGFEHCIGGFPKLECENTGPRRELEREHWEHARQRATVLLRSFNWPRLPPAPMVEAPPGVWTRKRS